MDSRKLSRASDSRKLSRASDSSRKRSLRPSISEYVRRASNFQTAQAKRKLSQKEKVLDKEIEYDESELKGTSLQKARRLGEIILHSKQILLLVVVVNLLDCCLVLGELILDIHYIKELLHESEEASNNFVFKMQTHYPDQLSGLGSQNIDALYDKLLAADCTWSKTSDEKHQDYADIHTYDLHVKRDVDHALSHSSLSKVHSNATNSAHNFPHADHQHSHSVWEELAHGLHKASITLLAMLVFETLLKILFMGQRFFHKRLEVFDGFIVLGSFILDLIFLKGLTVYRIQDGILILSFLLPWRVIRVVNSLIVAIIDHEHFRLKLLYKEKKTIASELKELKEREEKFESILSKVEIFCEGEGIPKWKIRQHTATLRKQSTITSFASLALGGMLSGFLESQHKAVSKTISEPVPHVAAMPPLPRRTSSTVGHDITYAIAEENETDEDDDDDNTNTTPLSDTFPDNTESALLKQSQTSAPIQIIVTPAQDITVENNENDTEHKPLLQRQDSVGHDGDNLFIDRDSIV